MADDGFGNTIHIPSVFIDETDGDDLKDAVEKEEHVTIKISFATKRTEKVDYRFYINIAIKESFVMIREFNKLRRKF